jgi:1-acyl-sn-glycerol-3-phosphate acyltransferase
MAGTLRRLGRLIGFGALTAWALVEYLATIAWRRDDATRGRLQSQWLHRLCGRVARLIRLRLDVRGRFDAAPLMVSNHLSYLDIVTLGAVAPLRFVAKAEVRAWPWFGWLARCAGTIFVRREDRRALPAVHEQLRHAARVAVPVVIFPEGTSTDGRVVRPFHSALLAVAAAEAWPVFPLRIEYDLPSGDAGQTVCWWGEMTLLPHLWRLLGHEEILATVRCGRRLRHADRKVLAAELHAAVCDLGRAGGMAATEYRPLFAKPRFVGS